MARPIVVLVTGLNSEFLRQLKLRCEYSETLSRNVSFLDSLEAALPLIQEARFQDEGVLFVNSKLVLSQDILNPERVIRILADDECEPIQAYKGESEGVRWICPEAQWILPVMLRFPEVW